MYDPAVQRAVLEKLARWRHLPEGDLIAMLSPVERLRFRPEALDKPKHVDLRKVPAISALKSQGTPFDHRAERPLVHVPFMEIDKKHARGWHVPALFSSLNHSGPRRP